MPRMRSRTAADRRYHPYGTRAATQATVHRLTDAPRIADLDDMTVPADGENKAESGMLLVTGNNTPIPTYDYPGHGSVQGWIRYGRIINGRRTTMEAVITPPMISQGTAASYDFPFITRRSGGGYYARGHLLAKTLGGSGSNPRNLVPLLHVRGNIRMYTAFESLVRQAVVNDNIPVRYSVAPIYRGPTELWPSELRFKARNELNGTTIIPDYTFSTGI